MCLKKFVFLYIIHRGKSSGLRGPVVEKKKNVRKFPHLIKSS